MNKFFKYFLITFTTLNLTAADKIDFSKQIRPILSDKCFHCHGPDEQHRKGKLRLDISYSDVGAFRTHKGSTAIKPNDLENSEVWKRITTSDHDDVMPPPDSTKKPLNEKERELIKRWIQEGAKWQEHWAFHPIHKPSVPEAKENKNWVVNEIDNFVLDELKKHSLKPTNEAPRYKLIRRLYLDLIGQFPTPEEVKAFEDDKSPNAYEKIVDRLLADPRYGERMALDWLDISRYGDTSVFHADGPRTMWPWRDWVIDAFNNNKPYNEFSIEQLAGDLIPNATPYQKMATAFLRNNGTTDEGGAFDEEYRVEYTVDRLSMTSTVWLGLTMGCAQCHDHKYDPISQKEFYQLYAFFNIAADKGMQTRNGNAEPKMIVPPSPASQKEIDNLKNEISLVEKEITKNKQTNEPEFQKWLNKFQTDSIQPSTVEGLVHYFSLDNSDGKKIQDLINPAKSLQVQGRFFSAKRNDNNAAQLKNNSNYYSDNTADFIDFNTPYSIGAWTKLENLQGFKAVFAKMDSNNNYRGFDLFIENDKFGIHLVNSWANSAIKILSQTKMQNKKWHHLFATHDGTGKAAGFKLYLDGVNVPFEIITDTLSSTTKSAVPFRIGRREVGAQYSDFVDEVRIYNKVLDEKTIQAVMTQNELTTNINLSNLNNKNVDVNIFKDYYFNSVDKNHQNLLAKINTLNNKINTVTNIDVMIMQDMNVPRKTYVLNRGVYDQPMMDNEVFADTPDILPPMKPEMPKNRLGLAQWLMDNDNPLTARVTVNRFWNLFFGRGIVNTISDFGSQGSWPSHPQLLDYLAADFRDNGWNVKQLFKKILMSATYRQDSILSDELLEKDSENIFLARGPRFRLQGDFIRDNALFVSGLLNTQIGGPGTNTYQPPGLWEEVSLSGTLKYRRDSGEKLYRRSMYIYWKRSAPQPAMATFDAPTREKCVVQRSRTNTPLQALVTLNDEQFVEAARFFAERIMREGGASTEQKIDWAFSMVTARKPSTAINSKLKNLYEEQLKHYQTNLENAQQLLKIGEKMRDQSLDIPQHAAWTIIANLLINMDETVNKE